MTALEHDMTDTRVAISIGGEGGTFNGVPCDGPFWYSSPSTAGEIQTKAASVEQARERHTRIAQAFGANLTGETSAIAGTTEEMMSAFVEKALSIAGALRSADRRELRAHLEAHEAVTRQLAEVLRSCWDLGIDKYVVEQVRAALQTFEDTQAPSLRSFPLHPEALRAAAGGPPESA